MAQDRWSIALSPAFAQRETAALSAIRFRLHALQQNISRINHSTKALEFN